MTASDTASRDRSASYAELRSPRTAKDADKSDHTLPNSTGHDFTIDFPSNHTYDADLVMIFPRREGGEKSKQKDFTIDAFAALMLGENLDESQTQGEIVVDPFKRVLQTERCFLSDYGETRSSVHRRTTTHKQEMRTLHSRKKILKEEYISFVGHQGPIPEATFCELVATAIARRVQVACGLTTRMFRSYDNDEIIMTIKADDHDLRTEADRSAYHLQLSNRPFDDRLHSGKHAILAKEIGDEGMKEARLHLFHTRGSVAQQETKERENGTILGVEHDEAESFNECDSEDESDAPEMDPLLISRGPDYHPSLYNSLKQWGHTEEADGWFVESNEYSQVEGNRLTRFLTGLVSIPYDPMTYFAPYAEYRMDTKYQPFYRRYPIQWKDKKEETLFTQVDRIRLIARIINRHIGTEPLQVANYLEGSMFALHDETALEDLRRSWAKRWHVLHQPLNKIRSYFGEQISLYFAWVGFYTKMLVVPSIGGIITFIYNQIKRSDDDKTNDQGYLLIAFSAYIVLWSMVFSEAWKRKNASFNALWGMGELSTNMHYRPQFHGVRSYDSVTDEVELTYADRKRRHCMMGVSVLVVSIMVGIVCLALFGLFWLKFTINDNDELQGYDVGSNRTILTGCVTVLNAVQILVLNMVYRYVAEHLNSLENHRTHEEYQNYLVIKVFLFQFCNSFASLFYIAFIKRSVEHECLYEDDCLLELRDQLLILFLIRIVAGNFMEVAKPYFKYWFKILKERCLTKGQGFKEHNRVEKQAKLEYYGAEEAFDDYNELVLQFGFIVLFPVAMPLTPLLALVNNLIEIHVDSVKLCYMYRRPFPYPAKDIGAWFYIMRFMSYAAMTTNAALIIWTSNLFGDSMSDSTKAFVFVLCCQLCLMVAFTVERLIPDQPYHVRLLLRRHEHIVAQVFHGLMRADDDADLSERAERVDVTIYPNEEWENSIESTDSSRQ